MGAPFEAVVVLFLLLHLTEGELLACPSLCNTGCPCDEGMNQDSITVRADVVGSTDDFETNITLVYSPANFDHNPTPYNLDIVFTWKTPVRDGVWFKMKSPRFGHSPGTKTDCYLVPLNVTTCKVAVDSGILPLACQSYFSNPQISVVVHNNAQEPIYNKTVPYQYCWDAAGNLSYDICGPHIPSAPSLLEPKLVNDDLTVAWEEPQGANTQVLAYWLTLNGMDHFCCKCHSNTFKKFSLKEGSILNVTIKAGASVKCTDYRDLPCRWEVPGCGCFLFISEPDKRSTDLKSDPSPPSPPFNIHFIVWPIAGVFICILVMLLSCALILLKCDRKKRYSSLHSGSAAFVVASADENDENSQKIRELCHMLKSIDITPIYYVYECTSHEPNGPGALGINRWVEKQFIDCSFVLFVCTQTFAEEWNAGSNATVPIVWTARHFLDGILPNEVNISRFVVLLIGEPCEIPIDLQRMQRFETYPLPSWQQSEELERYLLNIPLYQTP